MQKSFSSQKVHNIIPIAWEKRYPCAIFVQRTIDTQRELFSKISNFWAWADILGWNFLRHLGYFRPDYQHENGCTHFCTVSSLSMFSIIQPLFLQKTKPLYPTPKYLFGSGIWIWAAKNLRFSLRVSVVRDAAEAVAAEPRAKHCQWDKRISKQKKREKKQE